MTNGLASTMWLYIGGLVLAIILLAAFWRKIVRAILLLAVLGLGGMIAWAVAQQATATRQVATVATVAARGSAAANIAVALLVGLFALGAVILGVYVLARRRMENWSQMGAAQYPQFQSPPVASDQGTLNALVQLEVLRALRELRAPEQTALVPLGRDDDDGPDGYGAWWGNA